MKRKIYTLTAIFALSLLIFSCRKNNNQSQDNPNNFLDLKVSELFNFENFSDLTTDIRVASTKATGVEIVQIYDAHPNNGGKLILTGSANSAGVFSLPVRIASRFKEVYVAKLSSSGVNEYVAVPVNGSAIQYNFGSTTKELTTVSTCDYTINNNFYGNLTIPANETYCVEAGDHVTIKTLSIGSGGTLSISGTASITKNYSQDGPDQNIVVNPEGSLTLPKYDIEYTVQNYGTLNFSGSGSGENTCQIDGELHNWGVVSSTVKIVVHGLVINDGTFTSTKDFEINSSGSMTNNCQFYIQSSSKSPNSGGSRDFKQSGTFTNNGYMIVSGEADFTGSGNKKTTLGLGSLIETDEFKIEGDIEGPGTQGSQITADDDSQTSGGSSITGYVDLWVKGNHDISPNQGTKGPHVTYHAYTVSAPSCDVNVAPTITSSLQIGGIVGEAITPYTITATGTEPITFDATNLPDGLTYNAATHVISGTPTVAGNFNINLTASNFMGDDTQTLVLVVTQPTAPPVITSALSASATVDESFNYTLTASGTGSITYNVTNLPDGLTFDANTQEITGSPTAAGTYNIDLFATNAGGSTHETLVLVVGTPPTITSALTASGTAGDQFVTYTLTATGSATITYSVTNLPQGLQFDANNQTIDGTPTFAGVYNVTLQATNSYGQDVQTLVIDIIEGAQPPVITSSLAANGMKDFPFSYTITADGSQPMIFDATSLPAGLTISGDVISGIPTEAGTFNIPLTATNSAGTDSKTLVLVIGTNGGTDTDGDGIPDNLDEYPTDPTRAFNSYYPNEVDFASVAFEDLWPAYGDYDFNDFVVNLNYKIVTNAQNNVVDVIVKYQIMADGASLENGFGLVFDAVPSTVESVTGCTQLGNAIVYDPKGFEAGHTNQTVIIPIDNINVIMEGGMANTIPNGKYVQTNINTVSTHFGTPQASIGNPPYNPFIFVDQVRGHEIHLKDQAPTEFVDTDLFGTDSDASDPAAGLYYLSATGLPWGIETPVNFDYPIEKADILTAHLKFAAWAQSSGVDYPDWYLDLPGYRNAANIYVKP
ncbi:MAG: LruC domain-containing protein [Bacteroidales bacterium]|nr:LruC domain-containing protein [Bacteroidales bacterium]